MSFSRPRVTVLLLLAILFPWVTVVADEGPVFSYVTDLEYDEVKDNIKLAITGRGINIANELHASDMLNRTGPDLGFERPVFKHAETIEFCSAVISLRLVEKTPDNVVMCPFAVSLYQLNASPEQTHVAYRIPVGFDGSEAVYTEVAELISGIVREALELD
ncbi:MAG: hypothetical protein H6981_11560 [Gammaproteobacteria bacterium]|nr:hypothetical protein [Gammaproteobacteria bacterium]MCP5137424.1 hypothetical protein [Gammaproteobacteria bacterium]